MKITPIRVLVPLAGLGLGFAVYAATGERPLPPPVPVQEPGSGKTRTARLWVYVRDDRNAGSQMPPAVWFAYSPDRKGIHPQNHLAGYSGVLQADAYGGYRVFVVVK